MCCFFINEIRISHYKRQKNVIYYCNSDFGNKIVSIQFQDFVFDQLDGDAARTDAHPARRQRLEQHRRIDDQNRRGKRHV